MSRPVTILYGTETFTAEGYAERTGEALAALGFDVTVVDMEDFDPDDLPTLRTLLVVTSTYGNGDPPANAEPLHDALMADGHPRLPHLRFSVCGLGDTTYPRFAQCGKDFDRRLAELGGHRFVDRTDCDVDVDPPWEAWLEAVQAGLEGLDWAPMELPKGAKKAPPVAQDTPSETIDTDGTADAEASAAPASPPPADADDTPALSEEPNVSADSEDADDTPQESEGSAEAEASAPDVDAESIAEATALHLRCGPPAKPDAPKGRRRNPITPTVAVNRSLTGPTASRDVRHIELDLTGTGLEYLPGDSIGVFPPNDPALVDAILDACGADPQAEVQLKSATLPLREALLTRMDVRSADPRLADAILAAGGTVLAPNGPDVHVLDALRHAGVQLDAPTLMSALRRQAPRLYSVASSQRAHPNQVHLVASVVRYTAYDRDRSGVATGWMADRLPEGSKVRAYLQPLETFRLASDSTDIIMIGPGTGVAPFRAFLQERELRRARGRSWLFFGSRHRATDYLYGEELENWRHRGVLTRLDLAFSRDQEDKIYVQHKMRAQAKALWSWLSGGAVVYVCGDAAAMAPDVHRALQQIAQSEGGMDATEARAWIRDLAQNGRYMRDVY